jgi:NDP-sugar pyrophosphorylase family protein
VRGLAAAQALLSAVPGYRAGRRFKLVRSAVRGIVVFSVDVEHPDGSLRRAVVEPGLVAPLPLGEERDFGHEVFPEAILRGIPLSVYLLARPVSDIGTPQVLEEVRMSLAHPSSDAGDE